MKSFAMALMIVVMIIVSLLAGAGLLWLELLSNADYTFALICSWFVFLFLFAVNIVLSLDGKV